MSGQPVHDAPGLRGDRVFRWGLGLIGGTYVLLVAALLTADVLFITPADLGSALLDPAILASLRRTLLTCTISTALALAISTPLGYGLSRFRFAGQSVVDLLVEMPLVLPPLVLGLSLLILFHLNVGGWRLEDVLREIVGLPVTYSVAAIILAQATVGCAYATRTIRVTFDEINPRAEQVARTLGCSQSQAFWRVALPQARRGLAAAGMTVWARSLGEFGPILIFAGATRGKTEVLSTSVYLEWSVGHLERAVAVSLLMVGLALAVLAILRSLAVQGWR